MMTLHEWERRYKELLASGVCATCRKPFVVGETVVRVVGSGRYNTAFKWHAPISGPCVPNDLDNTVMYSTWTAS